MARVHVSVQDLCDRLLARPEDDTPRIFQTIVLVGLASHDLTYRGLADQLSVTPATVRRWVEGMSWPDSCTRLRLYKLWSSHE